MKVEVRAEPCGPGDREHLELEELQDARAPLPQRLQRGRPCRHPDGKPPVSKQREPPRWCSFLKADIRSTTPPVPNVSGYLVTQQDPLTEPLSPQAFIARLSNSTSSPSSSFPNTLTRHTKTPWPYVAFLFHPLPGCTPQISGL